MHVFRNCLTAHTHKSATGQDLGQDPIPGQRGAEPKPFIFRWLCYANRQRVVFALLRRVLPKSGPSEERQATIRYGIHALFLRERHVFAQILTTQRRWRENTGRAIGLGSAIAFLTLWTRT